MINFFFSGLDRAAEILYVKIEKAKVRTPYERHFLLLCMATSVLCTLRCTYDDSVDSESTDSDLLANYSSPKILRLIEIFHQLKPPEKPFSNAATQTDNDELFPFQMEIDKFMAETPPGGRKQKRRRKKTFDGKQKKTFCDKVTLITTKTEPEVNEFDKIVKKKPVKEMTRGARGTRKNIRGPRRPMHLVNMNPDALCGIVFVEQEITARIIFSLFCQLSRQDPDLKYISVQYIMERPEKTPKNPNSDNETDNKAQEEVLKKFRMHECNLLISNTILEEGIDIPRCNVVVHFDEPRSYREYVQCKSRARTSTAYHLFIIPDDRISDFTKKLAEYYQINSILLKKCGNKEPSLTQQIVADQFAKLVETYKPDPDDPAGASVNLNTAIILLNRYCARLPSDTFTKLTPIWKVNKIFYKKKVQWICTLRLPINSPLKKAMIGPPMATPIIARRITALRTCKMLHSMGELDKNLMPIGKEGFKPIEPDWCSFLLEEDDELIAKKDSAEFRPGELFTF